MLWSAVLVVGGVALALARSDRPRLALGASVLALLSAGGLVGQLVFLAQQPLVATPHNVASVYRQPLRITASHVWLFDLKGELFCLDKASLEVVQTLKWPKEEGLRSPRVAVSDGERVLLVVSSEAGDQWVLASPSGWVVSPADSAPRSVSIAPAWEPARERFVVLITEDTDDGEQTTLHTVARSGDVSATPLEVTAPSTLRYRTLCLLDDALLLLEPTGSGDGLRLQIDEAAGRLTAIPRDQQRAPREDVGAAQERSGERGKPGAASEDAKRESVPLRCPGVLDTVAMPRTQAVAHQNGARGVRFGPHAQAYDDQRVVVGDVLLKASASALEPILISFGAGRVLKTFVDDDDVFELTTGSTDALSQVPLAEGRLVVTAEGPQGRREMQVLSRELGMLSGVLPLDDRVVVLGDGALAVFDRRTGERLDPAPLLTTFRAYTAPWGGPSTLFELWLLACPLALFVLLAAAALRGRLGALTLQRVALLAAVLNVCGLLSLVERVFHL